MLIYGLALVDAASTARTALEGSRHAHHSLTTFESLDFARAEQRLTTIVGLVAVAWMVLGATYFALGILVSKSPAGATLAALVLYVGQLAVFAHFDSSELVSGIVYKILIVATLLRGLRAGVNYELQRTASSV